MAFPFSILGALHATQTINISATQKPIPWAKKHVPTQALQFNINQRLVKSMVNLLASKARHLQVCRLTHRWPSREFGIALLVRAWSWMGRAALWTMTPANWSFSTHSLCALSQTLMPWFRKAHLIVLEPKGCLWW